MCKRCSGECKTVVIDGTELLTHYCFSPPVDLSKPFGFRWVTEEEEKQ